jgi:hypothetical protein
MEMEHLHAIYDDLLPVVAGASFCVASLLLLGTAARDRCWPEMNRKGLLVSGER